MSEDHEEPLCGQFSLFLQNVSKIERPRGGLMDPKAKLFNFTLHILDFHSGKCAPSAFDLLTQVG